jgi:hypothetical protein
MQARLGRGRLLLAIVASGLVLSLCAASAAKAACSMDGSQPDSGTLTLEYVKPSTRNPDRNDYRLSGTIRWNSAYALSCFDDGWVDWAYEHNLTYQKHFDRKIWSPDLSAFPASSGPYIDSTTASDFSKTTDHSFGLFRPERLSAGKTYSFSYSLFLPRIPPNRKYHSFYLSGQVLEKQCSWGLNCVNLPGALSDGDDFIGKERRFEVTGTTCWAWQKKKTPTPCPSQTPPSAEPAPPPILPAPTAPVAPVPPPPPTEPSPPPSNPPQPSKPPATPSRTVILSKGDSAQGQAGCVSSYCRFMVVTWKNFSSGTHSITCRASNGDEGGFYTYQRSGSSGTSAYCYYGFPGRTAWVTVDGVSSNRITW